MIPRFFQNLPNKAWESLFLSNAVPMQFQWESRNFYNAVPKFPDLDMSEKAGTFTMQFQSSQIWIWVRKRELLQCSSKSSQIWIWVRKQELLQCSSKISRSWYKWESRNFYNEVLAPKLVQQGFKIAFLSCFWYYPFLFLFFSFPFLSFPFLSNGGGLPKAILLNLAKYC